jgi:uncharacterized protein YndB with AHSA1/START domain
MEVMSMINVDASTVIKRPVAEVFAFVANFENQPKWAMNFLEAKQTSVGPIGVGTTFRCVMKVPGQKAVSQLVITEFEPNRKIAFRGDQPAQAKPVGSMLFESVEGGTKVSSLPRPEMGGIFKLLEPLMAGMIRKSNEKHLQNLKRLLESAAP